MTDSLFTFVLDFAGGTYLSQYRGESLREACEKWVQGMDTSAVASMDKASRLDLASEVDIAEAVRIEGLTNVWCLSFLPGKTLGLVHVIRTYNEENPKSEIQNPT